MKSIFFFFKSVIIILLLLSTNVLSNTLNKIEIIGNDRISKETIKLFISTNLNEELNETKLNTILKDLYKTNFFKNISVKFTNQILYITVLENPIIENIIYKGIKSNRILDLIKNEASVKTRSSFNENIIKKEKLIIENILKNLGYYNSSLDILID